MLPSTLLTVSASASFGISELNSAPHRIAVYASQPPSPTTTQHSLAGARYGLPAPVFHRLDRASFSWRTSNLGPVALTRSRLLRRFAPRNDAANVGMRREYRCREVGILRGNPLTRFRAFAGVTRTP